MISLTVTSLSCKACPMPIEAGQLGEKGVAGKAADVILLAAGSVNRHTDLPVNMFAD